MALTVEHPNLDTDQVIVATPLLNLWSLPHRNHDAPGQGVS
jgi:hypothetical protein